MLVERKATCRGETVNILFDEKFTETLKDYTFSVVKAGYLPRHRYVYINKKGIGARKAKKVLLHRFLTNCPEDMQVDHINGESLDNRLENLRICDRSLNHFNKKKRDQVTSSKFKGVCFDKRTKRWSVHFGRNWVGRFATEDLAAEAYNKEAHKRGMKIFMNDVSCK